MTFRLRPQGWLCNRLRALLSHRAAHGSVECIWDPDMTAFLDLFMPLEGVTFVTGGAPDVTTCGIAEGAPADWTLAYADLHPVLYIHDRIHVARKRLGEHYAAMHIRRTDMTPLLANLGHPIVSDEAFWHFVVGTNPYPVWLATDNGETQEKFKINRRVITGPDMGGREQVRGDWDHQLNGPVDNAVVDLFVCAGSRRFMGSGTFGTFSWTIENLRKVGNYGI